MNKKTQNQMKQIVKKMRKIRLINKIDEIIKKDLESYYKVILIENLIEEWRKE